MWQVYFGDNLSIGIEFNPPFLTVSSILLYLDAKVLQKTGKIAETERIFSFLLLKEAYNYIISVVII